MDQELDDEQYASLIQLLGKFLPDATYQVIDTQGKALSLRERAKAMIAYTETSKDVSAAIVTCVLGGKQYIAQLWDARTMGTHELTTGVLVINRYDATGTPRPKDTSGKLVGCLTIAELDEAMAAGREFTDWLEAHKPVNALAARQQFTEIGSRYKTHNADADIEFVFTLAHAQQTLAWLAKEGHIV